MHNGQIIFAQLLNFLPRYEFNKCVERYRGNYRVRKFTCFSQFLAVVLAQLTGRKSLRGMICRQHHGQSQREKRLAHLGRFCPDPDRAGKDTLCPRGFWRGVGPDRLCLRLHNYRPVSLPFPMGAFPQGQGCGKATHILGLAWQHSSSSGPSTTSTSPCVPPVRWTRPLA